MRATVPVFITDISFPRKKPGGVDRAFIEMKDDADCHPFKVAVATKDARALQDAMESNEEDNDVAQGQITITYPSEDPEHAPEAYDKDGPVLRPHSIEGWWEVWSDGRCIVVIRPEEMRPVIEASDKKRHEEATQAVKEDR